jgi:hypothetical protein
LPDQWKESIIVPLACGSVWLWNLVSDNRGT